MYGNPGRVLPPQMPHVVPLQGRYRRFIVHAFDPNTDSMAGFEEDAIGPDFDIEFINLIRCQGLPFCMHMIRKPWL
jgi:hypothetical protein